MGVGAIQKKKKGLKGSLRGLVKGNKVENPILPLAEPSGDTALLVEEDNHSVSHLRYAFCPKPGLYLTTALHYSS